MTARTHFAFAAAATVVVAGVVVWGFVLVGAPTSRRLERFDEQRLRDLQTIAREIQLMVEDPNEKGQLRARLPASLAEAARRARDERLNPRDPATGQPYTYTLKNETTYELCAEFARPRDWDVNVFWNHPAGRHCFTIDAADPPPF